MGNFLICRLCKLDLPIERFRPNSQLVRGYASECRTCYYKQAKSRCIWTRKEWNIYHQKRRNDKKQKLIDLMGGCCKRCQQQFPLCVYDMHHINPDDKDFGVSTILDHKWSKIEEEAIKCVLLCSNCHRIIHQTGEPITL